MSTKFFDMSPVIFPWSNTQHECLFNIALSYQMYFGSQYIVGSGVKLDKTIKVNYYRQVKE